jgi:hypothetical protein
LPQRPSEADADADADADAERILHHEQADHGTEKDNQRTPASFQPCQICVKTDGGEESEHQRRLKRRIETHGFCRNKAFW